MSDCPFGALLCAICPGEVPTELWHRLLGAERAFVARLESPGRQREWIAGRLCLAEACARFSAARIEMLPLPSGAAAMPEGLCGSISHKGPLVLALATRSHGGAVGVDVECVDSTDDRLEAKVLTGTERRALEGHNDGAARFVAMHFAAKEAIYKALPAADQATIDFDQIELRFPEISARVWLDVSAKISSGANARAAVLFDGEWIIAAARRD